MLNRLAESIKSFSGSPLRRFAVATVPKPLIVISNLLAMNKILKNSFIIPARLAGVLLFACTNDGVTPVDEVNPVVIPENIAAGTTAFAFNFFKNLQETQPATENLFVSPLSLHMAMGMLLNGAESETAGEILKTLKMEGIAQADLNKAYKTLLDELPLADSRVNLGLANSVWYRNDFQVETDFQNVLRDSFDANVTACLLMMKPRTKSTSGRVTKPMSRLKK